VTIDPAICQGHALCFSANPEIFTLDDLGYSNVTEADVPPELEADARTAAQACPEQAIRIID
jgi:ferredoxin